ncbi:MAG: hypothetical protein C4525_10965 [Desulfarculus sp.]|nr:MAG: hypothetical protein C4525_10965 [Desulfarculus sp.]
MMLNAKKAEEALNTYLRLHTFPVALRLVERGEKLPSSYQKLTVRPSPMPICQGISLVRRYGWKVLLGPAEMTCPLGALAMGFVPPKEAYMSGEAEVPYWVRTKQARAKIAANLPKLAHGKYEWLIAAPLGQADFEPQLVLVYGNPAQMMRLVQSVIYLTGEPVVSNTLGAVGCGTYIAKALMTGECQMVVCGAGDRIFALTQDDEMVFAVPAGKMEEVLAGLEETHRYGMRYPVSSYLRFSPELPGTYQELMATLVATED